MFKLKAWKALINLLKAIYMHYNSFFTLNKLYIFFNCFLYYSEIFITYFIDIAVLNFFFTWIYGIIYFFQKNNLQAESSTKRKYPYESNESSSSQIIDSNHEKTSYSTLEGIPANQESMLLIKRVKIIHYLISQSKKKILQN